jgi:DNA helicase-2/ATP-dependent DNA helicase PcrA
MDTIIEKFRSHYNLNDDQVEAITSTDGPVQIIAGPGAGKTLVLILRTLYLLMSGKASPSEIILTTFTEKATFELRDRISLIAQEVGYPAPLYDIKIGTMHGICTDIINVNLKQTPLQKNYVVLDDVTQQLFLFERFAAVFPAKERYLGKWDAQQKWSNVREPLRYFDKITEETVSMKALNASGKGLLAELASAYEHYEQLMFAENCVDFAHLQKIVYDLLQHDATCQRVRGNVTYIMIDEYQDTNYIQEQIFLRLAAPRDNLCIVGDEDQALYRFRGGTVRNILEFGSHFAHSPRPCATITLSTNYRSHEKIVAAYDRFMRSAKWQYGQRSFRFPKQIKTDPDQAFSDYPAVFRIHAHEKEAEAETLAQMIAFFKANGVIRDYSDVAVLLRSVQRNWSAHYIAALERHGIPYFNPRARHYLENAEIKLMFACYADIFRVTEAELPTISVKDYVHDGRVLRDRHDNGQLRAYVDAKAREISHLEPDAPPLPSAVIDYFYELLAHEPFSTMLNDQRSARNLGILSKLITTFQIYYNVGAVTFDERDAIKRRLFSNYLYFLLQSGVNEYEDPDNPLPKGLVQIMTVHQAKGLEFPVVVVGSLNKKAREDDHRIDTNLEPFYKRGEFEPKRLINEFDAMRLFYVAFSRAERFLVLTASGMPMPMFTPLWNSLPTWDAIKSETLRSDQFSPKSQYLPKKAYSLVSHIDVYETCPQQYLMYKEYGFAPARFGGVLFGALVHQTIEDVHRKALEGRLEGVTRADISTWFDRNYRSLLANGYRPIGQKQRAQALQQVLNYVDQNREDIARIINVELDVSVEKQGYIMAGKMDLLLSDDGKIEAIDFKTQQKPPPGHESMARYERQLHVYGHILQERYQKRPDRLRIYWTSEKNKENAITEINYSPWKLDAVGAYFDDVVKRIKAKEFAVKKVPDKKVCRQCDFRFYCAQKKVFAELAD